MSSELPAAYFDTVFVLQDQPNPLPSAFAIVTAFNPMDASSSEEANKIADGQLKALLAARGYSPFRATGSSPDRSHSEAGWAFASSLTAAVDIARFFSQRALWWISNDQLYLVDCENPEPNLVARFSERALTS